MINHIDLFSSTPLEVITPIGDPIIKEVTAVLREWLELWKKLFVVRVPKYTTVTFIVMILKYHLNYYEIL